MTTSLEERPRTVRARTVRACSLAVPGSSLRVRQRQCLCPRFRWQGMGKRLCARALKTALSMAVWEPLG